MFKHILAPVPASTKAPRDLAAEIGKRLPFDHPEVEAYLNLVRTYEHLAGYCAVFFRSHGLTSPQYNVLRILRGHGERMRTHRVANEMISREPDITRLIDRLVQRGWVLRNRCPDDRRVVWVTLTREGTELLRSLDRPVAQLHRQMLGHLTDRELRQLSKLLFKARHQDA